MDARRTVPDECVLPDGRKLVTREQLHDYPGKRVITRASLDDQDVVAKFYLGRWRGWWEWYRGAQGAHALAATRIPAPSQHYSGYVPAADAWVLILDYIEQDRPWPPDGAPTAEWHEHIIRTLAQHHQAGIIQNDLNWTNFRPCNGVLYTLDTDRVRYRRPPPLDDHHALWNLIRLYAYKADFRDPDIRHGYAMYCRARRWRLDAANQQAFVDQVQRWRRKIARGVARKSLRGWKHYRRVRQGVWHGLVDRRRIHPTALPDLVKATASQQQDGAVIDVQGHCLRAHRVAGRHYPLAYGSVEKQWANLVMLRRLRIRTELPAALLQKRDGFLHTRGWIFTVQEPHRPLHAVSDSRDREEPIVRQIGILLDAMQQAGLSHDSLTAESFGLTPTYHVLLLDWRPITRHRTPDTCTAPENLITSLAGMLHISEEQIRALLENPYMP